MRQRENYKRYGFGGPKKVVEPQWVKKLPKDDLEWTPEQDMAYYEWSSIYGRRGYSKKEWEAIHKERQRIKEKEFKELSYINDYNGESILLVLKKKLEWQAEYFENFGHCESNPYKAERMRLCCRLIDIVCWGGQTKEYQRSFRNMSIPEMQSDSKMFRTGICRTCMEKSRKSDIRRPMPCCSEHCTKTY